MWQMAALSILLSGPGPTHSCASNNLPSMHMMEHELHQGTETLSVTGLNGGRSPNRTIYGFLPYWGNDTWLRYDLISILACFCVDMNGSGTISAWNGFPSLFSDAIDSTNAAGGIAIVTVVNFSSAGIHSILTTNRDTAISTIVDLVASNPVNGVSIDFENVSSADRDNLTEFMMELRSELDTAVPGSHLSICTPAVDWSDAFDYTGLAQTSDALFIMCYPFHGSWSTVAGPCCPLTGWGSTPESSTNMIWTLGDYAKYAPGQHDKIVVGLPYYGHEWETAGSSSHSSVIGGYLTLLYTTLADRAATYGRLWDDESLTPWYAYYSGSWNQGWFDDEESLELKYDIVREADFQGVGIWALGYDGSRDELWNCLDDAFAGEVWNDSITDNLESRFTVHGPQQFWRNVTEGGLFYGYFYTYSISSGPDINWAEWTFDLPDSNRSWMLDTWLPAGGNAVVDYRILHNGTEDTVTVDQSLFADEWVALGGPWDASDGLSVIIGDDTGISGDMIVVDAVRFSPPTCIEEGSETGEPIRLLLISANPSSAFLLQTPGSPEAGTVSIYDSAGRLVFIKDIQPGSQEENLFWPVNDDMPAGMYAAIYRSGQYGSSIKLVMIR
ncbi:MAG: hypothetical protein KAR44_10735 [Candidatus Aegiribacteria sp.]|nr:hypothetical protein [Candidatus Aegiribacteria sp.]